ncbi:MAG: DNA alkylation repair protein [Elusimicrobia bacterium]|nr:DNA alkylation repair protein [Elusimicrobiota bacterium]
MRKLNRPPEKPVWDCERITARLRSKANPANVRGMAKFGINPQTALGVNIPFLRALAKEIGKNQALSLELWQTKIHEARILAVILGEPSKVGEEQMESWVKDINSWDLCDQLCSNLFDKTAYARRKAVEWSKRPQEFVRRAGYVLMATLAVHDKKASDGDFISFFPLIKEGAKDERNFVKKAVSWALRQIGKRNARLMDLSVQLAKQIGDMDFPSAKWIAADALREFEIKSANND